MDSCLFAILADLSDPVGASAYTTDKSGTSKTIKITFILYMRLSCGCIFEEAQTDTISIKKQTSHTRTQRHTLNPPVRHTYDNTRCMSFLCLCVGTTSCENHHSDLIDLPCFPDVSSADRYIYGLMCLWQMLVNHPTSIPLARLCCVVVICQFNQLTEHCIEFGTLFRATDFGTFLTIIALL